MLMAIKETHYQFPKQKGFYRGKVRDLYFLENHKLIMIATDRISAFDHILHRPIPYKGQVLNGIAYEFLNATSDIVPNWLEAMPHPNVMIGKECEPFKVEMVIRGYLCGHSWREYKAGKRMLCGVKLPENMRENQAFHQPIITPTTKVANGHDADISKEEIIQQGIVSKQDYEELEAYTYALFERGSQMARQRGLILADTKYEFGKYEGKIYLIDEVHTPDSSRYFYADDYAERMANGETPRQLSKEFVRQWLIDRDFMGKEGQTQPDMPDVFVENVSQRYIELYERLLQKPFVKIPELYNEIAIKQAIQSYFGL
ncbi:MAG: phosphoribosylaminoimidazolesuccinocarboxamide synthase [Cytophagales bacterium]|nr:phosphoribosylaminoimidazolesuccinocarboxamide synthase [Cytophagales bacterium]MDW8384639.1 phosphoribosylaminoimidazolesuccinocarboxamide synthase [Flammeovirgaceae bacterium]